MTGSVFMFHNQATGLFQIRYTTWLPSILDRVAIEELKQNKFIGAIKSTQRQFHELKQLIVGACISGDWYQASPEIEIVKRHLSPIHSDESQRIAVLINRFGGLSAFSRALGHKHPTTVQGWKDAGKIPPWRVLEIKAVAAEMNINIGDLLPEPAE